MRADRVLAATGAVKELGVAALIVTDGATLRWLGAEAACAIVADDVLAEMPWGELGDHPLRDAGAVLARARARKDSQEIELIRGAAELASEGSGR